MGSGIKLCMCLRVEEVDRDGGSGRKALAGEIDKLLGWEIVAAKYSYSSISNLYYVFSNPLVKLSNRIDPAKRACFQRSN